MNNAMRTISTLNAGDKWDHFLVRIGYDRSGHRVQPGLYLLGNPNSGSPVFVTANYTLSFDALRSSLDGIDCHILVLDTFGINVWCAAGKGTFGTDELVRRIESTNLKDVVNHRTLILPQLGAPGVAAHEVTRHTGFSIEYGPVRAADIPKYMKTRTATPEMREVKFDLKDRAILIPVEVKGWLLPAILISILLYFLVGMIPALALFTVVFSGVVLFPILLPWIPTGEFSSKGFILGVAVSLPFAFYTYNSEAGTSLLLPISLAAVYVLMMSPWVAYLSLNFTGSTTFTSRTGVRKEIFRYIPIIAGTFISGVCLLIIMYILQESGMIA